MTWVSIPTAAYKHVPKKERIILIKYATLLWLIVDNILPSYKCNYKVTAVSFALLTFKIGSWIGKKSKKQNFPFQEILEKSMVFQTTLVSNKDGENISAPV